MGGVRAVERLCWSGYCLSEWALVAIVKSSGGSRFGRTVCRLMG